MKHFDFLSSTHTQAIAAAIAGMLALISPAQAQHISINDLASDHDQIFDVIANLDGGAATPISECMTIDRPGSYIVVRNLDSEGDCLVVNADHVTIDLNGFVLTGDGSGRGVDAQASVTQVRNAITVRNGIVTGFLRGIDLGDTRYSTVQDVRVISNTGIGLIGGTDCLINGNIISQSGNSGMQGNNSCTISDNLVSDNGGLGIFAGAGSVVRRNIIRNNNNTGLLTDCPVNVIGNIATDNRVGNNIVFSGPNCNSVNNLAAP